MTVVTVYAVFADGAEAQRIGMTIVEERLAACVNILPPCRSIYRWEGAIEQATESPALFKTTTDKVDALIARATELHSYTVSAIAVWAIERLPTDYADWVEASVTG
ncbi:MAG: divalent-cation tolerance protein CutA [Sphingomonas sp.]|uniref:divalent-cation tolerance protein CutA n=1 Tax=Sphingomonas sp. TaxID=28214 RepID=UPI00184C240A|nr:divalent-cation tolerance protein CutA [Sphingomonas sp.]MBA3667517.1 divalent-cation tolerance protein CutA [Sphingomonas sp.]